MGNITFGANRRSTKPYLCSLTWYYNNVMEQAGAYNLCQNNGNGYNSGFPYFGEHTYSGGDMKNIKTNDKKNKNIINNSSNIFF